MGEQVPHGHWNSWENRRQLFDSFMIKMNGYLRLVFHSNKPSQGDRTAGAFILVASSRLANALEDVYPNLIGLHGFANSTRACRYGRTAKCKPIGS